MLAHLILQFAAERQFWTVDQFNLVNFLTVMNLIASVSIC